MKDRIPLIDNRAVFLCVSTRFLAGVFVFMPYLCFSASHTLTNNLEKHGLEYDEENISVMQNTSIMLGLGQTKTHHDIEADTYIFTASAI